VQFGIDVSYDTPFIVKAVVKNSNLTTLGLCNTTNDVVVELTKASCFAHITLLDLSRCCTITDDVVITLVSACGGVLRTLILDNCNILTDNMIEAIATHCLCLRLLSIASCHKVTSEGEKLLLSLPELIEVNRNVGWY